MHFLIGGNMPILVIDPGDVLSAYVVFDIQQEKPIEFGKIENAKIMDVIDKWKNSTEKMVVEMMAAFGPASASLFDTCIWIGIFSERYGQNKTKLVFRKTYITFLLGNPRANDSHIRSYLIQRYGTPGKRMQKGNMLEGIKADVWQALALSIYESDISTGRSFSGVSSFVKPVEEKLL